jgi:hypothetical protein
MITKTQISNETESPDAIEEEIPGPSISKPLLEKKASVKESKDKLPKSKTQESKMISFEDEDEDEDDLF